MQDAWSRFRFGFAGAFSASVRARDSVLPPHPLFSARFRGALSGLAKTLAADVGRHELAEEWEAIASGARALVESRAGSVEPQDRHRVVARFTGFAYRCYSGYPEFLEGLGRQSGKLADVASRKADARDEVADSAVRIGGAVGGLLGDSLGSLLGSVLQGGTSGLRREASRRLRQSSIERLDFDDERIGQLPVLECDEQGLRVACPACSEPQAFPYERAGLSAPCPACGVPVAVPVPSARTVLARRKSAELRAAGQASCLGCRTPFTAAGSYVNPFAIAGFCGRKCFETHGKRFHLPLRFLVDGEKFQTSCRCGSIVEFGRGELRSVRTCESCSAGVVLPDEADLMRAADRLCPTCGGTMPVSAKLCKACSRRGA